MKIKYPDYSNSILNLACSVLKHYGLETQHNTLPILDEMLQKTYKNVVVMVLDGMGSTILEHNLQKDSFLRSNLKSEITSVFPPTTTAATTTLISGLSPLEHGWLGWSLYFKEINNNINIYINTNDEGKEVTPYHVANRYIPYKDIVSRINEGGHYKAHTVSPFGPVPVESMDELCNTIKRITQNSDDNYIYAYWPQPDSAMHTTGCYSEKSTQILVEINTKLEQLCKQLKDTLVIITADHGHMDGCNKLILDYPDLLGTLKQLPSIEPRALSFFVKEGMDKTFITLFNQYFGEEFLLFEKQHLLEKSIFGAGLPHPKFLDFIGDYVGIAISNVSLFNKREECEKIIGVHAGLTEIEMNVPLIIVEC